MAFIFLTHSFTSISVMNKLLIFFVALLSTNSWGYNSEINKGDWILRSGYTFLLPQFKNDSQVGENLGQRMSDILVGALRASRQDMN